MKKSILFFTVMLIFGLAMITNVMAATQTLGGVSTEGTLQIFIYDDGDMQVNRYASGSWQKQWYGTNSKSIRFYVNGTAYTGSGSYFASGATAMTTSSNIKPDANTGELILEQAGVVRIKQTTYYPPGAAYISYSWEITNLSGSTMNDLRFFSGGDTYLSGGDRGAGFWEAENNTVGVRKGSPDQQNLYLQGNTIPYAYGSESYSNIYYDVIANALTNEIDPNEGTDNGMALEWRTSSLAAGATWTINATEKFIAKTVTNLSVSAPLSGQVAPGGSVDLTYSVTNSTGSATDVTLNETIDLAGAGWTATIQSPSSPFTLAGDASQNVVIRVTCPGGTVLGTVAKATLQATDTSGTASDFCNVEATQVPTITSQPSDCSVGVGESASFSIFADDATSYQWQEFTGSWQNVTNGGIYSGATTTTLNISSTTAGMNGYKYRCIATNDYGYATSNTATLTVSTSSPATVTTQDVTGIGDATATGNGNITNLGVPDPTAHGVCWNTGGTPTIADSHTDEGAANATEAFTTSMTGLTAGTTYYVRAYATNTAGTSYGSQVFFTTLAPEINLKRGSTNIADGGSYDYGSHAVGTDTNVVFTIENTGTADLTLSGTPIISITGADSGQFSVQGAQPTSPVVPSGSTTFTVRFSPTTTGAKTASIAIANNDSNENPYNLTLNATGTVGALNYVKVENAANSTGSEVTTHSLTADQTFTIYAAGYDQYGNYISDQSVTWTGTGECSDNLSPTTGTSTTFTAVATGTGTITADHASATNDTTGTITVSAGGAAQVILTGPSTVTAGSISTAFTLTSLDVEENTSNVTQDTVFSLTSDSSGTATFYSDAAGTSVIAEVTIANGTSTATFYYKDSDAGTPTLTAAWNSGGTNLGSGTHQITVSLAATTLAASTSVALSFKDFKVTVTKIEMNNGTSWVTIFSGTAELDLVDGGGTFPGISDVSLPSGTYDQIRVTFRNSLPVTGTLSYNGTDYYTTTATFGGETNVASNPTSDPGSQTVFIFRIDDWGALNADVVETYSITPVTVGPATNYQPTLRFTISNTLLFKGTAGTASTYYFTLGAPTVSIVEP